MGCAISREAAGTLLTHAGPEIGVASTKAFTAQLTALFILAMALGQARGALTPEQSARPGAGTLPDPWEARGDSHGRHAI